MNKRELDIIASLMEELQNQMEYSEDDLSERLGRKKPGIEVMKIEGKLPDGGDPLEQAEDLASADMEGGSGDAMEGDMDEESMDPDDKLKHRLMRLRG